MKKQLLILFGAIGAFCVFAAPPIVSDVEVGNVHGKAVYITYELSGRAIVTLDPISSFLIPGY